MRHASADHPFPGLRSFEFDDRQYFFGREEHIKTLHQKLLLNRFVAVVGSSGSGKSSLVKAGLLGRLYSKVGTPEVHEGNWKTIVMRPLGRPLWRLARALADAASAGSDSVDHERRQAASALAADRALALLSRSSLGLIELLRELSTAGKHDRMLLIIDQFEELFRYAPIPSDTDFDERALFVKHLLRAADNPDLRSHILITMRSEFIGDCAQFRDLPEAINDSQFLTPSLTRNERKEAVLGPLRLAEGEIAPALLQKILNDVGQEADQLPVMQHALMRTWQSAFPSRKLTLEVYAGIGGIESAISLHAEGLLQNRTKAEGPPQQRTAGEKRDLERIFRALTDIDKDGRATRRPIRFIELAAQCSSPENAASLIDTFRSEDCAFLSPNRDTPLGSDTIVDVTHEALIRKWRTLAAWLDREIEDGKNILRLHDLATRRKTDPEFLLAPREAAERNRWWQETEPTAAWATRYLKSDDAVKFADIRELLEASVARSTRDAERIFGLERQAEEAQFEAERLLREKAEREAREKDTQLQLAQMARKLAEVQRQKLVSQVPLQSAKVAQTVFISHSAYDRKTAIEVYDWLVDQGIENIVLDIDPESSGNVRSEAILSARIVLLLVSRKWAESRFCQRELEVARGGNKDLMPILIESVEQGELGIFDDLRDFQFVVWRDSGAKERIRTRLTQLGLVEEYFQYILGRSPYPGLMGFDEEDAAVFFGRSAQIIEVLDRLRLYRQRGGCHILVFLGASGSGKSSFLRAGLWARLKRDRLSFFCLPVLRPHEWRWSERGLDISNAVRRAVESDQTLDKEYKESIDKSSELLVAAEHDPDGLVLEAELLDISARLARSLSQIPDQDRVGIVLAIDQAEELLRVDRSGGAPLLSHAIRALLERNNVPLTIIISIRSDCFEMLQTDRVLGNMRMDTFSLAPIPVSSFRAVITGPAHVAGLSIHPALVDTLLNDFETGDVQDSLPLLAFTLEHLYREHSTADAITLADYERLGGFAGSIEMAIEKALKDVNKEATVPSDRVKRLELLRRAFIPWLAGIDPETGLPRRRIARLSEIPPAARSLVEHLAAQRLLVIRAAANSSEPVVEVVHDAILRQWGLLRRWLTEDAGLLAVLQGVKRASHDWVANNDDASWLIHSADRLAVVEQLTTRPDLAAGLEPTDLKYISACRKAESITKARRRRLQTIIYVLLVGMIVGLVGWINQSYLVEQWRWYSIERPFVAANIWPYVLTQTSEQTLKPKDTFRECAAGPGRDYCPEMVVLPGGSFMMGSSES